MALRCTPWPADGQAEDRAGGEGEGSWRIREEWERQEAYDEGRATDGEEPTKVSRQEDPRPQEHPHGGQLTDLFTFLLYRCKYLPNNLAFLGESQRYIIMRIEFACLALPGPSRDMVIHNAVIRLFGACLDVKSPRAKAML